MDGSHNDVGGQVKLSVLPYITDSMKILVSLWHVIVDTTVGHIVLKRAEWKTKRYRTITGLNPILVIGKTLKIFFNNHICKKPPQLESCGIYVYLPIRTFLNKDYFLDV